MMFRRTLLSMAAAMVCGVAVGWFFNQSPPVYGGGSTDRHEDFVMATGPVNQVFTNNSQFMNAELDGVWVLDYKSGKLLASTINRQTGKMVAFGEMDLVREFDIAPRANVHFMMTTGVVVRGQSVLYLMETTTGKMGIYSMIASDSGNNVEKILIRRVDMLSVRTGSVPPNVNVLQLPSPQPGIMPPSTATQNQYQMPQSPQNLPQMPVPQGPANQIQPVGGFINPNK